MIPGNDNNGGQERRTLWIVLLLNAAIAAGFFVSGFFADSPLTRKNSVQMWDTYPEVFATQSCMVESSKI